MRAACEEAWGVATVLVNNAGIDQPPAERRRRIPAGGDTPGGEPGGVRRQRPGPVPRLPGVRRPHGGAGAGVHREHRLPLRQRGARLASLRPPRDRSSVPQAPGLRGLEGRGGEPERYLATLWAPRGVRVNTLSPGGVLGEQDAEFKSKFCARVPLGRMATAEDLGGPLLFLASPGGGLRHRDGVDRGRRIHRVVSPRAR